MIFTYLEQDYPLFDLYDRQISMSISDDKDQCYLLAQLPQPETGTATNFRTLVDALSTAMASDHPMHKLT